MADENKASPSRKSAEDASQNEGNNTIPDHLADYNLRRPIQPVTGMRQGLPNYGDPHFALFLRKVFIKALGYSEDALSRPIVGIINTYSAFNPVSAILLLLQLHDICALQCPRVYHFGIRSR